MAAYQYTKLGSKTPVETLVNKVVTDNIVNRTASAEQITENTASSLLNTGTSYNSTSALAVQTSENILQDGADQFFAIAAKSVSRIAGADLSQLRRGASGSLADYMQSTLPSTKIASSRDDGDFETYSVI